MTILNLYLISVIWVLIIDLSDIIPAFKRLLARFLHISPTLAEKITLKPFDCSFCMTWWAGLIYLLVLGKISFLNITLTLLFSYLTGPTKNLLYLISDLLDWIIGGLSKRLR